VGPAQAVRSERPADPGAQPPRASAPPRAARYVQPGPTPAPPRRPPSPVPHPGPAQARALTLHT